MCTCGVEVLAEERTFFDRIGVGIDLDEPNVVESATFSESQKTTDTYSNDLRRGEQGTSARR